MPKFIVVRGYKCNCLKYQKGYHLHIGDELRLGKIDFVVKEIKTFDSHDILKNVDILKNFEARNKSIPDVTYTALVNVKDQNITCKYCMLSSIWKDEIKNLLVNLCLCKGDNNAVHVGCLMRWINYKITSKSTNNVATYSWENLRCEICTAEFPQSFIFHKKVYPLITIEKPSYPFIIFEEKSINKDKNVNGKSLFLIVPDDNNPIKIGRGPMTDMHVEDISVSRLHSFLIFENNKFKIFDNSSKFGTLIKLRNSFSITKSKQAIQIGRSVITMSFKNSQRNNIKEALCHSHSCD